jgi:predicted DNA-binding transcriptional regulator YafY
VAAFAIRVDVDGSTCQVDGRDVAAWVGTGARPAPDDPSWQEQAGEYVRAHPRPRTASGTGVAAAQRLAVLRRLAAGPASVDELLAAMRRIGWVAASDLENRLRDLRATDRRGARAIPLPITEDAGRWRLTEPFADLDPSSRRALAFTKSIVSRLDSPLAVRAVASLDALLPGVSPESQERPPAVYRATAATLELFDEAMTEHRPVRLRYFSLNSGRERTYELTPVRYVTLGPVLKAICVPVDCSGRRTGDDRQFALDRLISAEALLSWTPPAPEEIEVQTSPLEMEVAHGLYEVLVARNVFGISQHTAEQVDLDVWRVSGTFPLALSWDVLEQLCAWAGSVQVHEPLWLVAALVRRLRAGLRVMETGEEFALVKPEPGRTYDSHGEAVMSEEAPTPSPAPGGRARPIRP